MNSPANTDTNVIPDMSQSLARLLSEFSRDYNQRVLSYLHRQGYRDIRPSHNAVFGNLGRDSMRVSELAQRARVTQQAMGKMLKELERMGYIKRAIDDKDRRAKAIELTEQGSRLVSDQLDAVDRVREQYANIASYDDMAQLEHSLQSILGELDTETSKV